MDVDFSSQDYFRNPAAAIAKLQSAGPVVEVRFPILGRIWTTTTEEMADRVLKDSGTFSMRRDDGNIAGVRWWMPGIVRTLANHMLSMDEPDHRRLRDIPAAYGDGGGSLWRVFLVSRRRSSKLVRWSLVGNFQFPCSYLRDSVRTRQKLVWLKAGFTQHTACVRVVRTCPSSTEKNPSYLRAVD